MDLRLLDPFAMRNLGLVTRRAAMSAGWTSAAWNRALRRGVLEPIHPGVARLLGSPATPEQGIHAAVLAGGRSAVASHRSAARLWGLPRPDDDPVDIIVDRCATRAGLRGVVVHRPTDRLDMRVSIRGRTPSTNLVRTLVDLGAVVGSVDEAVAAAIDSGAVTPMALVALIDRHSCRGRSGVGPLRQAVSGWLVDGKPADSRLEPRMRDLLREHGLPPAVFHPPPIAGFEVDFLVAGTNVVLECVGWEFHARTRAQMERDNERTQRLALEGHHVFEFTWAQVTRDRARTARRIRDLLARWAPHVLDGGGAAA